jgi:hypothetical protein
MLNIKRKLRWSLNSCRAFIYNAIHFCSEFSVIEINVFDSCWISFIYYFAATIFTLFFMLIK